MLIMLLIVLGAVVVLAGVVAVVDAAVRRHRLGPPGERSDGLRDDLHLGIGINLGP